ncbi:MAG: hypothetical protein JWR11_1893 [Mycobacterium sp.]|nr:hypothetical protein [Mycobacterium sp.]MDT5180825.1 hypothetical protein [Mycobacterium sp.]
MTEPIPHADEADLAEQARPAYDDLADIDSPPDEEGGAYEVDRDGDSEADVGDVVEQRQPVWIADDERPGGGH